ncbi:MAG: type IV pilus biogenesis/stability protein PilW [Proteobacteria bacterium]|nr:type IV pilus biogenesis/stability protein PilW [Pseudomonadota bacterium]
MTMKKGKFFILIALTCTLVNCGQPKKIAAKPNEANGSLNSLYEIPPADKVKAAKLNIELGVNYLKQEQISRAKSKFIRAKDLAPNLPEVHYTYGYFLERVGENDEAEKAYLKAISLNSKEGNAHNMYGAFLCRQKNFKQAEKEFLKAVDDPNFTQTAEAYENAGLCVLQIPEVAKATEYLEKSLRYDLNRPSALLELAIIKFQSRQFDEAKDFHAKFAQISKANARSLLLGVEIAKHFNDKNLEQRSKLLLNAQYPNATVADLYKKKS